MLGTLSKVPSLVDLSVSVYDCSSSLQTVVWCSKLELLEHLVKLDEGGSFLSGETMKYFILSLNKTPTIIDLSFSDYRLLLSADVQPIP